MRYTIDKQEKFSIIQLHEEKLDSEIAPKLKAEIITLHAEGIRDIVIDFSEVKYVDSSGLSAILVGNRILHEDGGIFVLTNLSEHIIKLIKVSQLDSILDIVPTVDEGIEAVMLRQIQNELEKGD